jgi:hypothetical protein
VTAGVARTATEHDHRLLPAYLEHVRSLGLSDRALRDRLRAARALLAEVPDLAVWQTLPINERLAALERTRAWPLVVFAIGTGRLRLDLELMTGKNLTGLGRIVHDQHRQGFGAATEARLRLVWTPGWVTTVLHEGLAVLIAWHGGDLDDLDDDVLQEFTAALTATSGLPASSLRAYRTRLASLRQILFELQTVDASPRAAVAAASATTSGSPPSTWPSRSGQACCVT